MGGMTGMFHHVVQMRLSGADDAFGVPGEY
jgi:hypothetical protein